MLSLTMIILIIMCLGLVVIAGATILVIGLQNREHGGEIDRTEDPMRHRGSPDWLEDLSSSQPSVDPAALEEEIRGLLIGGRKIEAIKIYREATGAGLKEAKEVVDALQEKLSE